MASVLTDFTKKREFLVCMDSDGCVMDTVSIKHTIVMCPELIRVFALDDHADFVASAWEEINLRNITRGLSRFESVVLVFDRLKNRGIEVPGSEDISAWVNTSAELSTASLQHELLRTGSLALRKLQEWNNACNRRIQALEPTFEPFPGVEESLRQLHAVADVAVVSAANESAIASEWKRYGLARHADVIFGQEVGSKANSIATMLACGYESRKVMMVGDAMGDAQAAAANGVAFVPILPGREADSWRRLQEEALPKLLHGTFSPEYQAELLAALRSALREDPDVILVGEMRDYETISAAVTAAETGHLVMSTLHTIGAAQTIDRIIDVCPPGAQSQIRGQLSTVLRGVITQQLLPLATGRGRWAATEILVGSDAVCNLIRENKCFQIPSVLQSGAALGMHSLNGDLARLVDCGKITREAALRCSTDKKDLEQYF